MIKPHTLNLFFLGMLLTFSGQLFADALSLKSTYELAKKNDPQWAAVKNQYAANQQINDQARAGLLPQISLTGTISHDDVDYSDDTAGDSYESHGYAAELIQPLFRLNSWHTYKQGKALESQYAADFQNEEEEFYLRVLTRYLEVLRANANANYRRAEKEAISRQLEQSKQRFEVGLVAITDVHEAQAAYDAAVSTLINAESDQFVTLRILETLTGSPVDNVLELKKDLPIVPPEPLDLNQWIEQALNNNALLQSAIFASNAAEQNYKSKKGEHAPTVDLVGSHSFSSTEATLSGNLDTPDATRNTIAIQLSLPLYSGGAISANRRQSQYQFLATKDIEHLRRREVIQNTTNFYQLMIANVAQVNAQRQSQLSAKVALEATQAGYEAGTRTIVDVLNVQRNQFQAERDYVNARFDYVLNALRLKQATGSLTEEELLSLNQWVKTP